MAPGSARGRTGSSATPLRVCCAPSPSAALLFLVQWRVKRRSGGKRAQWARANRRASSPAVQKGGQRVLFAPRPALLPSRGGAMGPSHQKVPRTGRDRRGGAGGAPGAVRGRGRVRICCKGAPGRDRPRTKARNINDSLPATRRDPGLCNRFGQRSPSGRSREGYSAGSWWRSPVRTIHVRLDHDHGAPALAAPGGPPGGSPAGIATTLRDAPAAVREIVG